MRRGASPFNIVSVALGLAFLYLPIVILMIYSFNASRLVTVWGGWSLVWYRELLNDEAILSAAWISFRVAFLSATAATVLGTLAAVSLTRMGRFRGRLLAVHGLILEETLSTVNTGMSRLGLPIGPRASGQAPAHRCHPPAAAADHPRRHTSQRPADKDRGATSAGF